MRFVPFELYSGPISRPESMGGESFRYYLFKFSLYFRSVGICNLTEAFGNPFSALQGNTMTIGDDTSRGKIVAYLS